MDEAHEQIADIGTVFGLVERGNFCDGGWPFSRTCSQRECRLPDYAALASTLRGISDSHSLVSRHNQRLSRKVSKGSGGR